MSNWISVKDNLPPIEKDVLVFGNFEKHYEKSGLTHTERNTIMIASISDTLKWYWVKASEPCEFTCHVTHWQELPLPPKAPEGECA